VLRMFILLMHKCLVKKLNTNHGISSPTRGLIAFLYCMLLVQCMKWFNGSDT